MKAIKKGVPRIISAVDLTHLQPNERIGLIGNENLKTRRDFLEKLLKAGIAVGLPAILFSGCEPEIKYIVTDEEDCPTYTPTTGNNPCACILMPQLLYLPGWLTQCLQKTAHSLMILRVLKSG